MDIINATPGQLIWLGFQWENLARAVTFDFSTWAAQYGEGDVSLLYIPPGSEIAYPMTVTAQGTTATWTLTNVETQFAGYGWALWSYRRASDGLVVKTCRCPTSVTASPEDAGDAPPDPEAPWVEQVLNAAQAAQEAAEAAQESLDKLPYPDLSTGTWWRWNSSTGQYEDTGASYGGGGGGSSTFVFRQTSASARWVIPHNLAKFPSVTVVDSSGRVVVGDVAYQDGNNLTVTFSGAFSGVAYLN